MRTPKEELVFLAEHLKYQVAECEREIEIIKGKIEVYSATAAEISYYISQVEKGGINEV